MEDERNASREAVEDDATLSARFRVVLFEDGLSPATGSPQHETVDAAADCDIYLGLFGIEHGEVGLDGRSPTEREYRAATAGKSKEIWLLRLEKSIGKEEPALQELLNEICDTQKGHSYAPFRNCKHLKEILRRKLRDFLARH